jgi:hypothetical protein
MKMQRAIASILVATGVLFAVLGFGQLTQFTHLHTPSSYFIETSVLNQLIAGDPHLEAKLKNEEARARAKLSTIFSTHTEASVLLIGSGVLQVLLGLIRLVIIGKSSRATCRIPDLPAQSKETE